MIYKLLRYNRLVKGSAPQIAWPSKQASAYASVSFFLFSSEVETLIPRGVFQKLRPQQWTILIQDHFRSCHSLSPHQARRTFLGEFFFNRNVTRGIAIFSLKRPCFEGTKMAETMIRWEHVWFFIPEKAKFRNVNGGEPENRKWTFRMGAQWSLPDFQSSRR